VIFLRLLCSRLLSWAAGHVVVLLPLQPGIAVTLPNAASFMMSREANRECPQNGLLSGHVIQLMVLLAVKAAR
jgi:hypothetical protein